MMLRKLGLWVAAMALACVSPAVAQTTGTITFKNATGQVVSVACQFDSASVCHYRDVFEGLPSTGPALPTPITVDATDFGLWSHVTNWPSAFGLTGALPAGTNAIGSITNTSFGASQSGNWSMSLLAGTASIGSISNTIFGASQSGTWNVGANCLVVSAEQAYTAGATQGCTMTPTGRLKVGLSSAQTNGSTGSIYSDLMGGLDPSGNGQGLQVDSNKNLKVASQAPANLPATPAVTVTTAATLLIAQRTGRASFTLINTGATAVWISGSPTMTAGSGSYLPGSTGASITYANTSAVYGATASGSDVVSVQEQY